MRAVKESDAVFNQKKKKLNRKVTHINFYQLDLCAQRVCKHNSKKNSTVERIESTIPSQVMEQLRIVIWERKRQFL